jgi:hypothetical protein
MPIKSLTECANMAEKLGMSSVACGEQPDRVSPTHAGRHLCPFSLAMTYLRP